MIRLKLTHEQLTTLMKLIRDLLDSNPKGALSNRLIHAELVEIYKKLYGKALFAVKEHRISLSPAQGIAFILFFQEADLTDLIYENNLIRMITNTIHPKVI